MWHYDSDFGWKWIPEDILAEMIEYGEYPGNEDVSETIDRTPAPNEYDE